MNQKFLVTFGSLHKIIRNLQKLLGCFGKNLIHVTQKKLTVGFSEMGDRETGTYGSFGCTAIRACPWVVCFVHG